ncbi:MAG: hypothetical protein WD002_05845 [Pseudomonadales bacterium]
MTDLLDKIDAGLEEVEEQLLSEFKRLRDTLDPRGVGELDAGIRNALQEVTDLLYTELASSGDRSNLQLLTDRHEVLLARISVLRQLFSARVPLVLLEKAHEGVKDRRRRLEARVMLQRKKDGQAGSSGRSLFDHRPSQQRIARNKIEVTQLEEKSLDSSQVFLDSGIYSASRELSMLASLLRGGTLDRPPEEDMDTSRGRAIFESRELSYRPPPPVDKPRPKQQPAPETDTDTDTDKQEIAQTPEEIRRKLEARRVQVNAGRATFAAKDIEPAFPQEPPRKREKPLEPALEDDQQNEKDKDKETGNKEERKGPAIFEARDLSQTPFKKD